MHNSLSTTVWALNIVTKKKHKSNCLVSGIYTKCNPIKKGRTFNKYKNDITASRAQVLKKHFTYVQRNKDVKHLRNWKLIFRKNFTYCKGEEHEIYEGNKKYLMKVKKTIKWFGWPKKWDWKRTRKAINIVARQPKLKVSTWNFSCWNTYVTLKKNCKCLCNKFRLW